MIEELLYMAGLIYLCCDRGVSYNRCSYSSKPLGKESQESLLSLFKKKITHHRVTFRIFLSSRISLEDLRRFFNSLITVGGDYHGVKC